MIPDYRDFSPNSLYVPSYVCLPVTVYLNVSNSSFNSGFTLRKGS
ncbi:hypothetical protein SAMN04487895_107175 [Paenibacillus sophorae]|uniref:Uncharacterized protein n=1 Tax=Paenibacillus sophorae TaxID=1333845 RepID=A0A1H8PEY6_9BACL|nr:hypothetical protein SAMN04487895_107175 [Paenibacillus sophorae]